MLIDGNYLNQYVAPGLLLEFQNDNDNFLAALGRAPEGAISADGIRFNKLINNVGFLVNNTEAFTALEMAGKKRLVEWDKMDTVPTKVDDKEIRALAFDKRGEVRKKHSEAFRRGVRDYVIQKLAPTSNAAGMPVLRSTGAATVGGRLKLTVADMIRFYMAIEGLNLPDASKYNMNLCDVHKQDLLEDRASTNNYRDGITIDPVTGEISRFYKIKFWENNQAPIYNAAGTLKAAGALPAAGDQKGSIFYYGESTVYHLNGLKMLYKPENQDTESADPTSEFRLQGYGLCDKIQEWGFGAVLSGNE